MCSDSGVVGSYHEIHFAPYYGMHMTLFGSAAQLDVEANHDTAPLTKQDDWQYRSGWPSGYAYGEAARFDDYHGQSWPNRTETFAVG